MTPFRWTMKTFLVSLVVLFSLIMTACPKDTAVHKAARVSYELSGTIKDTVAGVDKLYTDHVIDQATKNKIADKLILIAKGGQRFNQAATTLNNTNTNIATTSTLAALNQILSEEIAGPFLEILDILHALPPGASAAAHVVLAALRTAILTISAAVSENSETDKLLRRPFAYV